MLIAVNPDNPQQRLVSQIVATLRTGGVIAYPTDTTYGLGCSIFNKKGVERIYQIKQRDRRKPFSFICSSLSEVSKYAQVSNYAFRVIKKYLPGPYTFVMDATNTVPDLLTTRQKTVGIRMPDNRICAAIAAALGDPIVTTSANLSGEEPIGDPRQIFNALRKQLDLVVDGGLLTTDVSTVISLVDDRPLLLRKGLGDYSWCQEAE